MQSWIILPKNRTTGEKKGRFNSVQVHGTSCSSSWQKTEGEEKSSQGMYIMKTLEIICRL